MMVCFLKRKGRSKSLPRPLIALGQRMALMTGTFRPFAVEIEKSAVSKAKPSSVVEQWLLVIRQQNMDVESCRIMIILEIVERDFDKTCEWNRNEPVEGLFGPKTITKNPL